jgi:hypothetical protein
MGASAKAPTAEQAELDLWVWGGAEEQRMEKVFSHMCVSLEQGKKVTPRGSSLGLIGQDALQRRLGLQLAGILTCWGLGGWVMAGNGYVCPQHHKSRVHFPSFEIVL